jgi:hypothetical protein
MAAFQGPGRVLDAGGIAAACDALSVHAAELWAVLTVETRGCGFLADRRPLILFERHYFSRLTRRKFDAQAPDISQKQWGGYSGGSREYDRLARALKLDRAAALRSASWGLGQVMGENFKAAGFPDVEPMVAAFVESENAQLGGMAHFIAAIGADRHLRAHNWPAFAAAYNGPAYAQNSYDERPARRAPEVRDGRAAGPGRAGHPGLSGLPRLQSGPGGRAWSGASRAPRSACSRSGRGSPCARPSTRAW